MEWTAEEKDVVRKVGKASSRGDSVSFVLASPQRTSTSPRNPCVCVCFRTLLIRYTQKVHTYRYTCSCVFLSVFVLHNEITQKYKHMHPQGRLFPLLISFGNPSKPASTTTDSF